MSSNRYGQIWHGDHHHINIRFPSNEARLKFQEDFEEYHNSHDHDGDIPIFKAVTTKDLKLSTGSRTPEDMSKRDITIDGYHWSEIRSYQDNQDLSDYNWYRPPTCCVPPTIVIDSKYVSSADLKRHPLSAIFGDMPDSDFQSLLSSVESDGFIEPVIRIYEGQILDGWHRYRAAQELGIIRKLRFREWNADAHRDGDPKVFVLARNIERRHLNASQRAQIAVTFNERFGHGTNRFTLESPNGDSKTRQELAKEAGVGTSTIDRAVQVEKAGQSEKVISGEKSASAVIEEITVKELWEQINPAISAWKKEREGVGHASKTMFIKATLRWEGLPSDTETDVKVLKELLNLLTTKETNILEELIRKQLDGKSLWDDTSVGVETVEQETAQPSQTAEEREANKLLKQKKQAIKGIWDKRKQAARDWLGTEDNDLTTYTDLDALEEAFIAYEDHAYCADAFQSGMRRTSEQTFNICLEKMLASDVSLETLEAEYKAVSTYALDILQWKQQEWIQQLIDKKRKKTEAAETPSESADSEIDVEAVQRDIVKTLLEKVEAEVPKWRERYKQSGKKESELVSRASLSALIHVYRNWENASGAAMEEGTATAEELEGLLKLLKDDSYVFIYRLRDYLRETDEGVSEQMATEEAPDKEGLSEEFRRIFTLHARFARDIVDCRALGETYHLHEDDVREMMGDFQRELGALEQAVRKEIKAADSDISVEDIADRVEVDDTEVVKAMISKVQLDEAKRPETELPLQDALDEMKERHNQTEVSDTETTETEIALYHDLNHLRVLQNTLSPLLESLGADDMAYHHKDILTADLYDVFLKYEQVPTEKEMIVALLDLAHSILFEEIPNE